MEAVIAVKGEEVVYFNKSASLITKADISSAAASELFPAEVLVYESDNFTTSLSFGGEQYSATVSQAEEYRVFSIHIEEDSSAKTAAQLIAISGSELKSAMSVFQMSAALLMPHIETLNNPKLDKYSAMLNHSYHTMLRLAENFTRFSQANDVSVSQTQQFELVGLCADIVDTVEHLSRDKGIALEFKTDEDAIAVCGDPERISRMLLNLLSNSFKFTAPGGSILVSIKRLGERAVISVADNGAGIESDVLTNIFTYYNVQRKSLDKRHGVGLGMTLVRQIAEQHGGTAIIESKPGRGTKVSVTIATEEGELILRSRPIEYGNRTISAILTEMSDILSTECYSKLYSD